MPIKVSVKCLAPESSDDVETEYESLKRTTKKAVLVLLNGDQHWLPFSHIVSHDEARKVLRVTNWIAEQVGI